MKLGIKIAPGHAWKQNIESARPRMVEIWYNASKPADYTDMFAYVSAQNIDVGLHYWGALPNGLLTNICYPDPAITKPSLALIHATIDAAANNHCRYVNIHNDMRTLQHIDANFVKASVASKPADLDICIRAFTERVTALTTYAHDRGVVLTVETVPIREKTDWYADRATVRIFDHFQLPMDVLIDLARRGISIANDFSHTACNVISDDGGAVWRYLYDTTKTLAPATRLIHLGCIVPPYNGTDFHDQLDNPALDTSAAIPNRKQMIELLKLFKNREDVWILVEPIKDHIKNYVLSQKIIALI